MHTDTKRLKEAGLPVTELGPVVAGEGHPLLFATVSGAHLYGFPSKDSDVDLRGVHILPAADLLGLREPEETRSRKWDQDGVDRAEAARDVESLHRVLDAAQEGTALPDAPGGFDALHGLVVRARLAGASAG
ncbi:hypothetical protein G3I76_53140 [Streptomyces sp. SID11233]|nr:hypothetical protein [Streptomyces sp. SID11233]